LTHIIIRYVDICGVIGELLRFFSQLLSISSNGSLKGCMQVVKSTVFHRESQPSVVYNDQASTNYCLNFLCGISILLAIASEIHYSSAHQVFLLHVPQLGKAKSNLFQVDRNQHNLDFLPPIFPQFSSW
jgi:hypothetical protein